jgi:hypothetical protein
MVNLFGLLLGTILRLIHGAVVGQNSNSFEK